MASAISLEAIITFLLEAPMFGDLDAAELSEVVHIMQVQRLQAGQFVFREGEPGDAWYVLYDGQAEVVKNGATGEEVITTLGPSACFGEMGVLGNEPRSASIRTLSESTAFRFPREAFQGLLEAGNLSAYKLVHQIALVLATRQRDTTARLVQLLPEATPRVRHGIHPIVSATTPHE